MVQSTLPDDLVEVTIKDLLPSERAYTVPWAMCASECGELWINGRYTFDLSPGGTVQMKIKMNSTGMVTVYKNTINQKYSSGNISGRHVGATQEHFLPVVLE